jgi:hypothetical protein
MSTPSAHNGASDDYWSNPAAYDKPAEAQRSVG